MACSIAFAKSRVPVYTALPAIAPSMPSFFRPVISSRVDTPPDAMISQETEARSAASWSKFGPASMPSLSMSVKMMWRTPMDSMRSANAM